MSKLLVVIPVMLEDIADKCIDSITAEGNAFGVNLEDILIVDNSIDGFGVKYASRGLRVHRDPQGHNLGTSMAWNLGAKEVLERKLDYLVIMSASMIFGPELHTTWLKQMETFWGATVIESDGHSWHLVAINRTVFEAVGIFDENFYPAYFEQIDFCYRMRMLDLEKMWPRVWCNCMSQGVGLHNKVVQVKAQPLLDYYKIKWGGDKGEEGYTVPFGSKPLDYWEPVEISELVQKYKLEIWW